MARHRTYGTNLAGGRVTRGCGDIPTLDAPRPPSGLFRLWESPWSSSVEYIAAWSLACALLQTSSAACGRDSRFESQRFFGEAVFGCSYEEES